MVWKRKNTIFLLKALACLLAFTGMLQYACYMVRDKSIGPVTTLYEERRDSVDVLFVGSSHVYRSLNTPLLWKEYGIAAFNMASSGQPLWTSSAYIEQALKMQKPHVVVVDLLSVAGYWKDDFKSNPVKQQNMFRKNVQSLRSHKLKAALIEEFVPREERISYYFDLIQYRSRLLNLKKSDMSSSDRERYCKGFDVSIAKKGAVKITDVSNVHDTLELSPQHQNYLNKIIELSRQEGFSLVFANMPYVFDKYPTPPADQKRYFNRVREIAEENGIPFLDFTEPEYDCGIDWQNDTDDQGLHLNIYGAEKCTMALGRYLTEHYNLPDRRGDPSYDSWGESYEKYLRLVKKEELKKVAETSDYFKMLNDPDYLIIFTARGTGIGKPADAVRRGLVGLGLMPPAGGTGDGYLAVLDGGRVEYQEMGEGLLEYASENLGVRLHAVSAGQNLEEGSPAPQSSTLIDGDSLSANKDGLNIVVYDKLLRKFVDRCWIVSKDDEKIVR